MINKSIENKSDSNSKKQEQESKKPNEFGGVYFSSHIKIYDPNSKEVLVQKRADD
jgi:hypothetical protein